MYLISNRRYNDSTGVANIACCLVMMNGEKNPASVTIDPAPYKGYDKLLPARREDVPCNICSDKFSQVNHGHFSSEWLRRQAVEDNQTDYFCPTCRRKHSTDRQNRRSKIILASSTLHNALTHLAVKTIFHIDVETIPGAKTWDLERALTKLYLRRPDPVDVVVVCGLNQVKMHL